MIFHAGICVYLLSDKECLMDGNKSMNAKEWDHCVQSSQHESFPLCFAPLARGAHRDFSGPRRLCALCVSTLPEHAARRESSCLTILCSPCGVSTPGARGAPRIYRPQKCSPYCVLTLSARAACSTSGARSAPGKLTSCNP